MSTTDIAFNNSKGYYDFDFTSKGDFVTTHGLDTAILMSLFIDKRAANSEVPITQLQRGWWGNLVGNYVNYEIGSKLWLLQQARSDINTLNHAKNYVYDCLKWLLDDKLADRIIVDNYYNDNKTMTITITIYKNQSVVYSTAYTLWQNTTLFNNGE